MKFEELEDTVFEKLSYGISRVKRAAKGKLFYDYLVPNGPYDEQWDWDGFFTGISLIQDSPENASFLRNWSLNFLENADTDGKIAGCLTPQGWDPRLHQLKPLLAQGCYFASTALQTFDWLREKWDVLKVIVTYRFKNLWSDTYQLGVWHDSMESGADNNPAVLEYPHRTVVAVDVNSFLYRELVCLHLIAEELGFLKDSIFFKQRAKVLRESIWAHLWSASDSSFWNVFTGNHRHIKRISYSNFIALWAGLAPEKEGIEMIQRYLTNSEHMWTPYGITSLSKQDNAYNNENILKPHSNWQGPIWPIANYFYMHALLNYGFAEEANVVSRAMCHLVSSDVERSGGMHENYCAQTGQPLAAPDFVSWNLLVRHMPRESMTNSNPLLLPRI
jgi:alpha,alpha-trehalase